VFFAEELERGTINTPFLGRCWFCVRTQGYIELNKGAAEVARASGGSRCFTCVVKICESRADYNVNGDGDGAGVAQIEIDDAKRDFRKWKRGYIGQTLSKGI